jgi:hypothetical protein
MVLAFYMARRRAREAIVPDDPDPVTAINVSQTSLMESLIGSFATLTAVGGTEPYVFTLVSGPSWLTVVDDELVADGSQEPGDENIVLSVQDLTTAVFTTDPITITVFDHVKMDTANYTMDNGVIKFSRG